MSWTSEHEPPSSAAPVEDAEPAGAPPNDNETGDILDDGPLDPSVFDGLFDDLDADPGPPTPPSPPAADNPLDEFMALPLADPLDDLDARSEVGGEPEPIDVDDHAEVGAGAELGADGEAEAGTGVEDRAAPEDDGLTEPNDGDGDGDGETVLIGGPADESFEPEIDRPPADIGHDGETEPVAPFLLGGPGIDDPEPFDIGPDGQTTDNTDLVEGGLGRSAEDDGAGPTRSDVTDDDDVLGEHPDVPPLHPVEAMEEPSALASDDTTARDQGFFFDTDTDPEYDLDAAALDIRPLDTPHPLAGSPSTPLGDTASIQDTAAGAEQDAGPFRASPPIQRDDPEAETELLPAAPASIPLADDPVPAPATEPRSDGPGRRIAVLAAALIIGGGLGLGAVALLSRSSGNDTVAEPAAASATAGTADETDQSPTSPVATEVPPGPPEWLELAALRFAPSPAGTPALAPSPSLDLLAEAIAADPGQPIAVTVRAFTETTAAADLDLSVRQAQALADELVEMGADPDQVAVTGLGRSLLSTAQPVPNFVVPSAGLELSQTGAVASEIGPFAVGIDRTSGQLRPEGVAALEELAQAMTAEPDQELTLAGYRFRPTRPGGQRGQRQAGDRSRGGPARRRRDRCRPTDRGGGR